MENVYIMNHPLIQHKISMLRNKNTGTNEFRKLVEEIGILMGYEALHLTRTVNLKAADYMHDMPDSSSHLSAYQKSSPQSFPELILHYSR